ncbi:MAG: hypothetical protein PHE16_00080 [Aliarcobacter sp.]|nr:hypothetical protein [Aliarcobacter sp.]
MIAFFGLFLVCLFFVYFMFSIIYNIKFILILEENFFVDCSYFLALVVYFTDALTHFELLEYLLPVFFFWWFIGAIFNPIDFVIDFSLNAFKD